ncbi:uncharacterized protein LOC123542197 [Mercenaria mercenaria]|uniref:uncharacterized protein LOC123542197 n=1 Tax=Mercenaria mercenaria TaxID=6596 RepID=UPI00234E94A4|nr:uncharacterized protein LOC123542197 [Mercenaria mercenaria]
MDQPANECPCKRQRVSEGDDIDQETGMLLDDSTENKEYEDTTEKDSTQREATVGQKSDSVLGRDTTQVETFTGAAGDSESNSDLRKFSDLFCTPKHVGDEDQSVAYNESYFEKEKNQSTKNVFTKQSARNDDNAHSFENQSSNTETGSQPSSENTAADVLNCMQDLHQSVGTAPRMQSNAGFCEYAQNIQAIAESSYIRNRERNVSQNQIEKVPKLESPKLKRPFDRVNTNLAKKRMETFSNSKPEVEEFNKTGSEINNRHTISSLESQLPILSSKEYRDQIEDKKKVESFASFGTLNGSKTNEGKNMLENSNAESTRTFQETSDLEVLQSDTDSVKNAERENQNKTNSNIHSLAEGFDVSGFVEMFSNSVMGNIMSGTVNTGSFRDSGRLGHMAVKEKDGGKGDMSRKDDKSSSRADDTEGGHEINIGEVNDDPTGTCKFKGLGSLLDDIGHSAEREVKAAKVDTVVDPCRVASGSSNQILTSTNDIDTRSVTLNRLHDTTNENTAFVGNSERRLNTSDMNCAEVHETGATLSSREVTVESFEGTEPLEAVDKELNDSGVEIGATAGNEQIAIDVKRKSTSTLINGRFRLDFKQTEEIINQNNINSLPITVLVHIFKNLNVFELLRRASPVCKYWYNLCRDPDLWRSICLVNQHRLSDTDLEKVLWFSDYRVRNINLTDCRFLTNKGVKFLVMRCPQIEVLRVMRCFDLTDVAFEGLYSLGLCSNLRALYMDGCCRITDNTVLEVSEACPQLRTLHLNQCTRISDSSIIRIAQNCPHLTNLQLDHCSQVTDEAMSEIVMGCPDMMYLNLMCCGITDKGVKCIAKLSKLTNLDLSNLPRLTSDSVVYLSKFCKNLQCINVSLNTMMDDWCIAQLAKNLPMLKRLYCVSCSISDKGLEDIAEYRPTLEALDVGWCQAVTDRGVRVISLACKHLDYFGLIRCDRVTIETIEELVLKYPRINYSTFILESRKLLERARKEGYQFKLP